MPILKTLRKSKEAEAEVNTKTASPPPPPYAPANPQDVDAENRLEPPDIAAGFRNLALPIESTTDGKPRVAECVAHLKLLESFYRLRQRIGSTDGLFGINNGPVIAITQARGIEQDEQARLLAKLAEKRWAVFVARAVDRFEKWYNMIMSEQLLDLAMLQSLGPAGQMLSANSWQPLKFRPDNLPPLDVLMVWHAYMLNPRAYLSDQLRHGKQRLWLTRFPWPAVDRAIDPDTFSYNPSVEAEKLFTSLTREPWINESDSKQKSVHCPQCDKTCTMPWTTATVDMECHNTATIAEISAAVEEDLTYCLGYCDRHCAQTCSACGYNITHDTLRAAKFRRDVERLLGESVPMPGTILGVRGLPYKVHVSEHKDYSSDTMTPFPNELLLHGLGSEILRTPLRNGQADTETVDGIRKRIEATMKNKSYMRKVLKKFSSSTHRVHNIAIRKMMSNYWENDSRFSLDLVGAVIRQGNFIEKMHDIDWLHSPALPNTMARLITKYDRFVRLMEDNKNMAVPTLDVDLAWHTHQLDPMAYMVRTLQLTKQFIDHDDKVAETKLNDAFEWTSKTYQRIYGEPYSECTCWYCEAIRERHTSSASRLFSGGNARAQEQLHKVEQEPARSVHISTHNAVRPTDDASYDFQSRMRARALEFEYERACDRARRKGRKPPRRDDYYYSMAYGYPVFIPAYSPYVGDMGCNPNYYACNPSCMAIGAGAMGNCCQGTCGGAVAAGGCAAGAGCAGGMSGGASACGAASGGGGCGGGGGGGGCGGGGGGGGCGGGGGS